jgi:hypothetical protein
MRYPVSEKLELIRLVEKSPCQFGGWNLYQTGGPEALDDRHPADKVRTCGRVPTIVRSKMKIFQILGWGLRTLKNFLNPRDFRCAAAPPRGVVREDPGRIPLRTGIGGRSEGCGRFPAERRWAIRIFLTLFLPKLTFRIRVGMKYLPHLLYLPPIFRPFRSASPCH